MKVSIITVCLNSEKTIEKTIKSVLEQNYQNLEYIIVDGGSRDNTLNILQKYKKSISKIISERDNGIYNAINKGIKSSTGEIISILHSDDFYFNQNVLDNIRKIFENNLNIQCLIGTTIIKKKTNNKIFRKYSPKNFKNWMLYLGVSPPHPSMFLKKKIYENIGLYNEKYQIAGDFEFYLRMFLKKKITYYVTNQIYTVMQHGGVSSNSIKSNFKSSKEILTAFKDNDLYSNQFLIFLRFPIKLIQFILKK
jgi:glycosyltransferase involved in cell wall biosynthesis